MEGDPVIIRYLDPPLHEFLPKSNDEINKLANSLKMEFQTLKERIDSLKEFNPMMGHRGCRLAITYPSIAVMQTKAVIEAAINVRKKGIDVVPEIMIPLIGDVKEFTYVKDIVCKVADKIIKDKNVDLKYYVGTMIEVPRACVRTREIAMEADFFSFGTNDLTQLTYGFSRDDASKFINSYKEKGILDGDPFASIDTKGVGELVKLSAVQARKVKNNISLGVCGEHGGDVKSIEFFDRIGLDYVSCSPYRVPIARLAAAQAAIKNS
jgi:pyruvate,orthophosphate dikinase